MTTDSELSEPRNSSKATTALYPGMIADQRPTIELAAEPQLSRALLLRIAELAIFLAAVIGAVALGLGIIDYFSEQPYVGAYLLAYAGFRVADLLVRDDHPDARVDELGRRIGEQVPLLALFAAAPFEQRTFPIVGEPPAWLSALGLLLALAGFWLALGARIQLAFYSIDPADPTRRVLVKSVFYRHVRHPMYLGMFLALVSWPLLFGAPIVFVTTLVIGGVITFRAIQADEIQLRERFGSEYEQYLRETDALIPSMW
ncbi:MAG: methyltransferase family protein [Candidatus Binataceae bacterium]